MQGEARASSSLTAEGFGLEACLFRVQFDGAKYRYFGPGLCETALIKKVEANTKQGRGVPKMNFCESLLADWMQERTSASPETRAPRDSSPHLAWLPQATPTGAAAAQV